MAAKGPVCGMAVEPGEAFATRTVELMPAKAGEFELQCQMGMLQGKLIVE
jgi:plastocyanin domain-containing protein